MDCSSDRVRYSRIVGHQIEVEKSDEFPDGLKTILVPKNTLYTIRRGEFVHFGIARCHSKLDRFNRAKGRDIAAGRAHLALEENNENALLHESGLRGTINADSIKNLLDYFQYVDSILLQQFNLLSNAHYTDEHDEGYVECDD